MIKKKSILTFVLAVCLIVPAIFMLTACGGNKNDPEDTKTEAVIKLDNAYVLTKTYDGQTVENPTETQITKDSDGEMTIEWYAGEIKLEEGPKNAGNYKLVISTAETDTYKAGKLEKIYTINKKQLTISGTTVEDKEYDGNNTATVKAGTLAGLVGGDEVSVGVTATGTFASKDVAYKYDVDPQDVTISYALTGDLAKNYFAPVDETKQATINPKPLVNVNLTKVYDGYGRFDRTALTTEQGIVAGESIEIYVNATGANVGVYKDGNEDEDFDFNEYVLYIGDTKEQTVNYAWGDTCTATIKAKQLTISGTTVADKVYDGTTDATVMTGTLAGLVSGDETSVSVSATGTFADKNAGSDKTVTIVYSLTGALANNYLAPKDETATATINKKELDLTEVPSREYNGDNRIQKLTSEGCVEGENVVVMYFLDSADAGDRTVTSCSFVAGYENYSIKSYSATATITQKVITEFNTTLTPQTGTSVSISASVDLDNGKTETVNFKFTVTSESVWNHAGELTLVLEKPLSTQVKIEIVDNPNYKLSNNLVGTLTIA